VSLEEIYDGIELKLKAYGNNVEKLFYVKPNISPKSIKARIEGAKSLRMSKQGELEVETELGVVKFTKPVAYQEEDGEICYVDVTYAVIGDEYSFDVENYDKSKELVIDPLLASTFLGGSGGDRVYSIDIDIVGNVFVAGCTYSSDFPTIPGTYDTTYKGMWDVFISKLDSNLQNLLASTFLGSSGTDYVSSISIDNCGNIYVVGYTDSSDFPTTPDAYDTTFSRWNEAFVSKFNSNLQNLIASTFLGGSSLDKAYSISIDDTGNVYVVGVTMSRNFPITLDAYDTNYNVGHFDAFVSKFDGNLENLLVSTFLGGDSNDYAYSISIDDSGYVFVVGETNSPDFPTTPCAYDTTYDINMDAYVSKFDGNLQNLIASTFLGDFYDDRANSVSIDNRGNVYVTGWTWSSDFPTTPHAYDVTYNYSCDGFISKFDSGLANLLASTFLGSVSYDYAHSIAIDDSGNVYVTGWTYSPDFPTIPGAYDTTYNGSRDAFVSKFDCNLENLLVSTFLGGDSNDSASFIAIDDSGNVYVTGGTWSSDFPTTPHAYDITYDSGCDAFISKFDTDLSADVGIKEETSTREVFCISQIEPNPFTQFTTISYLLPAKSTVSLKVYDLTGRLMKTLLNKEIKEGYNTVIWDGRDNFGEKVSCGFYFLKFRVGEYTETRKLLMIR